MAEPTFDPARILEPEIEYRPDAITIAVPLRVAEWGPTTYPCPAPTPITVALTEPPNGRPLVLAD